MSWIRKFQGPGEPVRDFVNRHEEDRGYPGFINLIVIDRDITSAPAIAEMVVGMVNRSFYYVCREVL